MCTHTPIKGLVGSIINQIIIWSYRLVCVSQRWYNRSKILSRLQELAAMRNLTTELDKRRHLVTDVRTNKRHMASSTCLATRCRSYLTHIPYIPKSFGSSVLCPHQSFVICFNCVLSNKNGRPLILSDKNRGNVDRTCHQPVIYDVTVNNCYL